MRPIPGFVRVALRAGLVSLALVATAARAAPLCRVAASVEPVRAVVGQQITYRVHLLRRADVTDMSWERNLTFPAFRAEWLPGLLPGTPSATDEGYQEYEERRALFPARAGHLEIPDAGLLCRTASEGQSIVIPAVAVDVVEPPAAHRPHGYTGVVGTLELAAHLDRHEVALGEAVILSVLARGNADVHAVRLDLAAQLEGDLFEVFERKSEVARDASSGLMLRRYFSFHLVPRRSGVFQIPALRVPRFDPTTEKYHVVTTRPITLRVTPALATAAEPPAALAPQRPSRAGDGAGVGLAVAVLTALAAGLALTLWQRGRARGPGDPDPADRLAAALEEARAAEARGDVAQSADALARGARGALVAWAPDAATRSTDELFALALHEHARALILLLQRLDRARFADEPAASEVRSVRDDLARLARRLER